MVRLYLRVILKAIVAVLSGGGAIYNIPLIVTALVVGLLGQTIRTLVAGVVPAGTSIKGTKAQEAVSLNTTGLYSVCRNPLYLGNFFMMLSPVILSGNFLFILVFVLAFWLYYERIVSAEEAFLTQKFREEYLTLPIKLLALYHRLKTSKKQP